VLLSAELHIINKSQPLFESLICPDMGDLILGTAKPTYTIDFRGIEFWHKGLYVQQRSSIKDIHIFNVEYIPIDLRKLG